MLISYDIECAACGHVEEIFAQRDDATPPCPRCAGATVRKYTVRRSKVAEHANACSLGFRFNYLNDQE
jgi:predicted nucleic acid-binding Zn ribbon protein